MGDSRGKLTVVSCKSGRYFANKVIEELKKIAGEENTEINDYHLEEIHFANTEIKAVFGESIRGCDVYIFQDVENSVENLSVDQNLMALKSALDAAWRCDANYATAVLPAFPYARQDRRKGKESITAAMIAKELEDCGAERVITLDIHNAAVAGFFRKARFENLYASKNIIDYVKKHLDLNKLCVVSPDIGGSERANHYAKELGTELGIFYKERNYSKKNTVEKVTLLGDVRGKDVLIVDDMLDTGGTMEKVVVMLKENLGCENVYFACSLPSLNGKAVEIIDNLHKRGYLKEVISTDAIYHGGEEFRKNHPWFTEVSVAKYFARVIYNINRHKSISALLK